MTQTTQKTRRVLSRRFVILFTTTLLIVISIFKIPSFTLNRNLQDLGYSDEAISAIKKLKISKVILDNAYYSDYLNSEIVKEDFKKDYLELYVNETSLTEDDFLLFDRLVKKGYTKEEVNQLFKELDFFELTPLLVFDKLTSIQNYISDCNKNAATNSKDSLILTGNYLKEYNNITKAKDIDKATVLVTLKHDLGEYIPEQLVPLARKYASEGVEIANIAYDAYIELWNDMYSNDLGIYALRGYRSYESQKEIYDSYKDTSEADDKTIRPGFAESQTGLDLQIVDARNENLANFHNTAEYAYLKDNAHRFGFIIRYPENKTSITGYSFIPYQIHYVGKDIATKVYESNLTWEEYYYLYLDNTETN